MFTLHGDALKRAFVVFYRLLLDVLGCYRFNKCDILLRDKQYTTSVDPPASLRCASRLAFTLL